MTAALEGGEWSAARPGRNLPQGKTRYPLYRRLGGLQGRSGQTENLVTTGTRFRTVQPVVSTVFSGPLYYKHKQETQGYNCLRMNMTAVTLMFVCNYT